MSGPYLLLKTIHVLSATVLFGTGLGTAFHMWLAHRTGDPRIIAAAARSVVLADCLFTTPAVIVQPLSGAALIWLSGSDPSAPWLVAAYALYVLTGACWLPVVALQIKVWHLAQAALMAGRPLPPDYHRCMRLWLALGCPAFAAVLAIFWLMVVRPQLG
ncbi:MAG: DUF2269 family protein [Alphaproteobacteria bacterium]